LPQKTRQTCSITTYSLINANGRIFKFTSQYSLGVDCIPGNEIKTATKDDIGLIELNLKH